MLNCISVIIMLLVQELFSCYICFVYSELSIFSSSDWFIIACLLSSMKRASSMNILNVGGKATEDHFQVRSPIIFLCN